MLVNRIEVTKSVMEYIRDEKARPEDHSELLDFCLSKQMDVHGRFSYPLMLTVLVFRAIEVAEKLADIDTVNAYSLALDVRGVIANRGDLGEVSCALLRHKQSRRVLFLQDGDPIEFRKKQVVKNLEESSNFQQVLDSYHEEGSNKEKALLLAL